MNENLKIINNNTFRCPDCLLIPEKKIKYIKNFNNNLFNYLLELYCLKCNKQFSYKIDKNLNNKTIDLNFIKCKFCNNNSKNLFYCFECKNKQVYCFNCIQKYNNKKHKNIISLNLIDYICPIHINQLNSFCENCNLNICKKCEILFHKNHKLINYFKVFSNKDLNNFNKNKNNLFENIKNFIIESKKLLKFMENLIIEFESIYTYLLNYINHEEKIFIQLNNKYNFNIINNFKKLELLNFNYFNYKFDSNNILKSCNEFIDIIYNKQIINCPKEFLISNNFNVITNLHMNHKEGIYIKSIIQLFDKRLAMVKINYPFLCIYNNITFELNEKINIPGYCFGKIIQLHNNNIVLGVDNKIIILVQINNKYIINQILKVHNGNVNNIIELKSIKYKNFLLSSGEDNLICLSSNINVNEFKFDLVFLHENLSIQNIFLTKENEFVVSYNHFENYKYKKSNFISFYDLHIKKKVHEIKNINSNDSIYNFCKFDNYLLIGGNNNGLIYLINLTNYRIENKIEKYFEELNGINSILYYKENNREIILAAEKKGYLIQYEIITNNKTKLKELKYKKIIKKLFNNQFFMLYIFNKNYIICAGDDYAKILN